ncbi:MAG: winged helix-turn-helix domain-containing protein [Bacteroidaceae bacterium]|nr:winged helix-turn-helix domain-containing protein [Bacteroidaceae bacterium]
MEQLKRSRIKENAEFIWHHLCDNCLWTFAQLREATGLSELDFNLAVGWLASEDKISFVSTENNVSIALAANVYI